MEGPVRELRQNAIGKELVAVTYDPVTHFVSLVFSGGLTWRIKLEAALPIRA